MGDAAAWVDRGSAPAGTWHLGCGMPCRAEQLLQLIGLAIAAGYQAKPASLSLAPPPIPCPML